MLFRCVLRARIIYVLGSVFCFAFFLSILRSSLRAFTELVALFRVLCVRNQPLFSVCTPYAQYNHRTLSFRFMDILAFRRWQSSTIASAIAHTLTALDTVKFVHSLLALSPLRMLNVTMHSDTYWQFVIFCVNTRYCIVRGRTNQQMNYYFSPKKRATTKNPKNRKIFSNHEFVSKNEWFRFFSLFPALLCLFQAWNLCVPT